MATAQDRLNQILPSWYDLLTQWSVEGSLVAAATEALVLDGSNAKADAQGQLQSLVSQWSAKNFKSLPEIVLLSDADISGAQGAYAASTDTIYLNAEWLLTATAEEIQKVLTEELGHSLDGQLNLVDTQGDEGEYFSLLLSGQILSGTQAQALIEQGDAGVVLLAGTQIPVEKSSLYLPITLGGIGADRATALANSPDGGMISTGYFSGTVQLGGTTLTSLGGTDIYVVKTDAFGNHVWAFQAGSSADEDFPALYQAQHVDVGTDGSIYISGNFQGSAKFGDKVITSNGSVDTYLAKLSSAGAVQWVKSAGSYQYDEGADLTVLSDGSCIYTGAHDDLITFGATSFTNTGRSGSRDIFIAKLDKDGNNIWAKTVSNNLSLGSYYRPDHSRAIDSFADDSFVIAGFMTGAPVFGSTTLVNTTGDYLTDGFVAKADKDGNFLWAIKIGSSGDDVVNDVKIVNDGSNSVLAVGNFSNTANLGTTNIVSSGSSDIFITKLDSAGKVVWVTKAGGIGGDEGYSVTTLSDGSIAVVGKFQGSATFGNFTLTSKGGDDIFVAKLDSNGNFLWATQAGGALDLDRAYGITEGPSGSVRIAGSFQGNASFGQGSVMSSGLEDAFLATVDSLGNWISPYFNQGTAIFRINGNGTGVDAQSLTCILDSSDPDGMMKFPPSSPAGYTYQWEISTNGTSNWTNATGTGNQTFKYSVNTTTDANKFLRVRVGYQDDKAFNEIVYTGTAKILSGTSKSDSFTGTAGIDVTFSGSGADAVATGAGNDFAKGGVGNDTFNGADLDGDDFFDGQTEIDTLNYSASTKGVIIDFVTGVVTERALGGTGRDTFAFIENARGSSVADIFAGNLGVNVFTGGGGADAYRFMNQQTFGASTSDRVADFSSDDKIQISAAAFGVDGKTLSYASVTGTRTVTAASLADKSSALVVYDTGTGQLYINKDGTTAGVSGQSGVFAVLDNKFTGLAVSNFGWAV